MKRLVMLSVVACFLISMVGCVRPYKEAIYEEIKPNETAFVLPLEGANKEKQKKFKSVEYLEERKVAAKRIEIPRRWHQKGRLHANGRYIPTVMVIKVDRSPITREWTANPQTGSTTKDDAIRCESKESIEWLQGVTVSASIPEDMAATFLYNYSGKTLDYVLDNNVRSFAQDYLAGEFAQFELDEARTMKKKVFDGLKKECREKFSEKGVLVENIGAAGGFNYVDPEIQKAINMKFTAEQKLKAAKDERQAAQEFAKAGEAAKKKRAVDIMEMDAQARLNVSEGIKAHGLPKYLFITDDGFNGIVQLPTMPK